MTEVKIGNALVGDAHPCFVIAEIGINHNGDIDIAKRLIDLARLSGCDAIKFQKRTIEVVYSAEELAKPRENPFGKKNGDLKYGLEFGLEEYQEIDSYCREKNISWFASCWDEDSVDFINQFDVPCYKIASASITDDDLLRHTKAKEKPIIMSTGMSTLEQIDHAVNILGKDDLIILHTTSTYPAWYKELNLSVIPVLQKRYDILVGYSGHETGIPSSVAVIALGACVVERHITLDRAMWGSDQAASLGPSGIIKLVKEIRVVENAMGDGVKKVFERELPIIEKLRRKGKDRTVNKIKAVALDVDGVLTDGTFIWGPSGEESKKFSFADVMGISLGGKAGLIFTLISGESNSLIDRFAEKTGIGDVYKGCKDKASALHLFVEKHNIALSEVCFMGDDVNDLNAMALVGLSAAPANAQEVVKLKANLVTSHCGGQGAVRELIDQLCLRTHEDCNLEHE